MRPARRDGPPPAGGTGGPTPTPEPPELSPERVRAASRRVGWVVTLTVIALLTSALPLPWQLVGLFFALAALVAGGRALRVVWASGVRRSLLTPLVVGLALSGVLVVSSFSVLATWPIQQEHQQCLARAITVAARDTCEREFRAALESSLTPGATTATDAP